MAFSAVLSEIPARAAVRFETRRSGETVEIESRWFDRFAVGLDPRGDLPSLLDLLASILRCRPGIAAAAVALADLADVLIPSARLMFRKNQILSQVLEYLCS